VRHREQVHCLRLNSIFKQICCRNERSGTSDHSVQEADTVGHDQQLNVQSVSHQPVDYGVPAAVFAHW
jgi:hypothetical protein